MTKQVRVLHIVPTLFNLNGVIGGAERYALELARNMADYVKTKLVSFGDAAERKRFGQLDVRIIGNAHYVRGQRTNPISAALIGELLKADVVHCHQQHVLASSLAAAVCRLIRRRVFVSEHGGGGWDISGYMSTDSWYHGHLHVSEYSRRIFGHLDKPKAHVILGGVDTEKFSPDSQATRDNTVLFVGRLLPHKGIDTLIQAMPPDMPLHLIGQPYDTTYMQDLLKLAATKRVTISHDCDDATLVDAYRRALCVVLPSVYVDMYGRETRVPELLGQTLLEGMACGTPAICTDVASMPEVVEDGVTGFVVPPNNTKILGEKLVWLREHPEEVMKMGRAARRRVLDKFKWSQVVNRCLEIYKS